MTLEEFEASLDGRSPPAELDGPLAALWLEASGDWHAAHGRVQAETGDAAAWVHAYLHRVEGDRSNAAYWYRRAGRPVCDDPLKKEWASIVEALLSAS